ncbi:bucentaur or craniofacial development domain-containing protein [Hirsutella rhossiliensis]|uniref:SWR1-complex protein 5 n=1 Tax=Hirsutella rhossiliensis TaxID=111463 RepID=A0A9P8SHA9_9HYPO|nr:bucentaur or craniofacial development domain-containing protein [Hirsutella rhossiliensis]KAH0962913.1 bucentaur or craniofacial development domain-containing protein [Hirsutella rhossiliensis]
MPLDPPFDHDDHQGASSDDSDFAPDDAPEQAESASESDPEVAGSVTKKRRQDHEADRGYDNSGDEAIIQKGRKRRKRANNRGEAFDDANNGGEGGLVKTRRQRAEEKAERTPAASKGPVTVDVDALWEQMISGKPVHSNTGDDDSNHVNDSIGLADDALVGQPLPPSVGTDDTSNTIRIKRTYNFAGRVHTEEKVVARDSAEARLYLATQDKDGPASTSPAKRATKKAFRSAFEPVVDAGPGRTDLNLGVTARMMAAREAQAKKLNTVEKSRMDWAGYVDKEGIKDELELASKSKGSYNARQDFLARSEALRDDEARRARMAARA